MVLALGRNALLSSWKEIAMTPRHTLDRQTVNALKTLLRRRSKKGFTLVRGRYLKQMQASGYTFQQAYDAYADCDDIAVLELDAEAANS
jgi:hypothetical protein